MRVRYVDFAIPNGASAVSTRANDSAKSADIESLKRRIERLAGVAKKFSAKSITTAVIFIADAPHESEILLTDVMRTAVLSIPCIGPSVEFVSVVSSVRHRRGR